MTVGNLAPNWTPLLAVTRTSGASDRLDRLAQHPGGSATWSIWGAEDGVLVTYTTTSVLGGTLHKKFVVQVFEPTGPLWRIAYERTFSTRAAAKRRALQLFADHSPEWAVRNGY